MIIEGRSTYNIGTFRPTITNDNSGETWDGMAYTDKPSLIKMALKGERASIRFYLSDSYPYTGPFYFGEALLAIEEMNEGSSKIKLYGHGKLRYHPNP